MPIEEPQPPRPQRQDRGASSLLQPIQSGHHPVHHCSQGSEHLLMTGSIIQPCQKIQGPFSLPIEATEFKELLVAPFLFQYSELNFCHT
ncbi:hypothetical protein DPEC_G00205690 [Dallia pectoralis]|uniref:Uncharacterized protein n=1 Tax=Dallia pectoralis TaxID=75939 RepID=A0ACC2G4L3_DALPE|nr:hypothetical protein DPEC_G00205690 [Dallia pectoralis]